MIDISYSIGIDIDGSIDYNDSIFTLQTALGKQIKRSKVKYKKSPRIEALVLERGRRVEPPNWVPSSVDIADGGFFVPFSAYKESKYVGSDPIA